MDAPGLSLKQLVEKYDCVAGINGGKYDVADIAWLLGGVRNSYVTDFDPKQIAGCISSVLATGERSNGRDRIIALGLDNPLIAARLESIYRNVLSNKSKQ